MLGKRRFQPNYDLPFRAPKQRVTAAMVQRLNQQGLVPNGNNYKARMSYRKARGAPQEVKYWDVGLDSTTLTNAATATTPAYAQITSICALARGDAANQRVGNKIHIKSIDFRAVCGLPRQSSTSDTVTSWAAGPANWRIIIYHDTQCNGAVAPINSILDLTLSNANPTNAYNNLQYSGRYKILMDKFFIVPPASVVWNTSTSKYIATGTVRRVQKHIECSIPITYVGDTADITNVTTSNIGILFIAQNNNHEVFEFRSRIRYTD